jgi:UPF0755 protein
MRGTVYPIKGKSKLSLKWKIIAASLFLTLGTTATISTLYLERLGLDPYEFYTNMANPYMRFVHIPAGLRREEIAEKYKDSLSWDQKQVDAFIQESPKDERGFLDGYYLPGNYFVRYDATGPDVARQMMRAFDTKVNKNLLTRGSVFKKKINLDTAIRVASIIQREAGGKEDMNMISGVIWNRIFKGMTLDMDATLQYVKGTSTNWWPQVESKDKYIDSPFNTYKYKGLPPTAIANPSIEALEAAYNPLKTDCIFYLHDKNGEIHCTNNYQAHKDNVQRYLIGVK